MAMPWTRRVAAAALLDGICVRPKYISFFFFSRNVPMRVEIGPVSWRALEESGNEDGVVTVSTRVLARLGLQLGQLL